MTDRTKIESAFRATTYRVMTAPPIDLRIDAPSLALDALLQSHRTTRGVYLTADNPHAMLRDEAANEFDRYALKQRLAAHATIDGQSIADAADWPIEHGVLVPGLSENEGVDVGREFGQLAILWLVIGEPVALRWCES